MKDATVVMQGSLRDFPLIDILQVVGISRQHTMVELRNHSRRPYGAVWLKSGRVLAARCGEGEGRNAFGALFGPDADTFLVVRLPDPPQFPDPLGGLAMLLLEASNTNTEGSGDAEAAMVDLTLDDSVAAESAVPPAPPAAAMLNGKGHHHGEGSIEMAFDLEMPSTQDNPMGPQPVFKEETQPIPLSPADIAASRPEPQASAPVAHVQPPVMPARSGGDASIGPRVIAMCSPKGGVGKSTLTLNLAFSLAQRGLRVVLVDADVNGDQMSMLDARTKPLKGAYDLLDDAGLSPDTVGQALLPTSVNGLKLLPATGAELPQSALERKDRSASWNRLFAKIGADTDVILVDCPAGMLETTRDVLSSASHVVGVFQSEMVSGRSFEMFGKALAAIPEGRRPKVAGVVVNMFNGKSKASLEAFQRISADSGSGRLFDTTIPRHDAFQTASLQGAPLRFAEAEGANTVAFLFDMLADELVARAGLTAAPKASKKLLL